MLDFVWLRQQPQWHRAALGSAAQKQHNWVGGRVGVGGMGGCPAHCCTHSQQALGRVGVWQYQTFL